MRSKRKKRKPLQCSLDKLVGKMKVVYFGTPQFAANVLKFLLEHFVDIAAVVTRTDKPKGRSGKLVMTPVKEMLLKHYASIPLHQPEKVSSLEFRETLHSFQADLFVVVAYGEILKQEVLDAPKSGCINLHASLLPKYRGAAPIQRSIIEGEKETGVTIMHMVKKMDAGDMIRTEKVTIGANETFVDIEKKLCECGAKLLLKVIQDFEKGGVTAYPQDETKVTFASKIEHEDCQIDWNRPAFQIHNLVRGVNPQPGAWCFAHIRGEKKLLKIKSTQLAPEVQGIPGAILKVDETGMVVACGSGGLRIIELQLEGKRAMRPDELLRGVSLTL